jgi:hypothetical protein
MSMAQDAAAPITRYDMKFNPLTMRDFAELQGIKGNEDKMLRELVMWSMTPVGILAVLSLSGDDPTFNPADLDGPVALQELASEIITLSMPSTEANDSRAEGNGEPLTQTG